MKTSILYIVICILIFSCKENTKVEPIPVKLDGYTISGNAPGVYNGLRAYLKSTNEKGLLKNQDTAIIMNEKFMFEGKVDSIEAWYLEVDSYDSSFPFIIDNANLSIVVNKDDIRKSKIEGNPINNTIADFNAQLIKLNDSIEKTRARYREMINNKENVTGMSQKVANLKDAIALYPHQFIKNNKDNPYSMVLIHTMIRRNTSKKGMLLESYDALNEALKNSNLGKRVAKSIPDIRKQYDIIAATHIGRKAPNFSAPNPNGKIIELNAIKGKATLIHFWSSWYGASRRENKRLVQLYDKYNDKGLEMIGVSLDGNADQKHPKSDWKKAIKDDQLIWNQISNLNYFNDTISKAYSIRSLPASFLLNSEGVIIGKNLNGNSLDSKLKELLELN
ncbi:TlpA disulfide reductase family protein [Psychroserpens ponticola]|uniref:TlpA disulfide reductase family protein n=1 Tax=Psychroserpens ponticola TaxID=2932268 RepID=A0ABY7S2F2_9FLAO|nr:TlpA disulfide reductase family protein [Psychroserpens ponticola]WCO03457.1 TlpA disulfide reductase family protein [Psychroserpens ponticola]